MHLPIRFATLLLLLLAWTATANADPPGPAQRRCMLALAQAATLVAEAAGKHTLACLRATARGQQPAAQTSACLAATSRELRHAQAKTRALAGKRCDAAPSFGPRGAEAIHAAFSAVADVRPLLGADLAATLETADPATTRCQLAIAREFAAYTHTETRAYRHCLEQGLARGQVQSAADLQACIGAHSARLEQAQRRARTRLAARCEGMDGQRAYPGRCAESPPGQLGACLTQQAHCGTCAALNQAGQLDAICHGAQDGYRDGVALGHCGFQAKPSVARQWDEEALAAIRRDNPRPPVHARNLFHMALAMYDAWAAYDAQAQAYLAAEHPLSTDGDRAIAVSFAAYRVLAARYSESLALGYLASQDSFVARMRRLGFDPDYTTTHGDAPAAVGNRIAAAVLAFGLDDGANESTNYADYGYQPVNAPLAVKQPDIELAGLDLNRWQPLALDRIIGQNGVPLPGTLQSFIGSHWGEVIPFALTRSAPDQLYLDPGPPPRLGGEGEAAFREQVLQVIGMSSQLDPDDGVTMDISPASLGHNPLGSNAGSGYPLNPVSGTAYAPQIVPRADFGRVLAEYWADGPSSETPPGHWNLIANQVADTSGFERRFAGQGPVLDALEWDVKTYFALNGALHDAAIAGWGAKRKYDGVRPITMIRGMAKYGQSSDPALPSHHPLGLPLRAGLVESMTAESSAPGQRHAHLLAEGGRIGDIAVLAWPGGPADPATESSGVRWVLGKAWVPFQRATFVTPAFPGYFSGHSVFSRSAAEVLAALTGSAYFPGGLREFVAPANAFLQFERGPSREVRLQWASYFDAADQAGQSRLWGGIHVEADDFTGRRVGHDIGIAAFARAAAYFDGTAAP